MQNSFLYVILNQTLKFKNKQCNKIISNVALSWAFLSLRKFFPAKILACSCAPKWEQVSLQLHLHQQIKCIQRYLQAMRPAGTGHFLSFLTNRFSLQSGMSVCRLPAGIAPGLLQLPNHVQKLFRERSCWNGPKSCQETF